jgi:hypothetical protein
MKKMAPTAAESSDIGSNNNALVLRASADKPGSATEKEALWNDQSSVYAAMARNPINNAQRKNCCTSSSTVCPLDRASRLWFSR